MKINMFFFFILTIFACNAILDYDRAILQAQKNNWPAAQEQLTKLVIDNPDRADSLYDLAVAAYKNNNFDIALNYFNKAATHKRATRALQQQAYFNSGNAHVQLKQLQEAIDAYDKVLTVQPDHKEALHNKEVVKKMLEQQKQQDNSKPQDDKQDKDQKKDQEKQDNKSSEDQKSKDERQQDQNHQKQSQDKKSREDRSNSDKQKNNQNQQSDDTNKEQNSSESTPKNDESEKTPLDENQSNPQEKKSADKGDRSKQNKGTDAKEPQNGAQPQPGQKLGGPESANAKTMAEKQPAQKLSAGLARVLEDREKKDAELNKKMTRTLVANQAGGKNDYNCW